MPTMPGLALQVQQPEFENPLDQFQKAMQLRDLMSQGRLRKQQQEMNQQGIERNRQTLDEGAMDLAEKQRQAASRKKMLEAISANTSIDTDQKSPTYGKVTVDHGKVKMAIADDPERLAEYVSNQAKVDEETKALMAKELERRSARDKRAASIIGSVIADENVALDVQTYGKLYAQLRKEGLIDRDAGLIDPNELAGFIDPEDRAGSDLFIGDKLKEQRARLQQIIDQASADPAGELRKRIDAQNKSAKDTSETLKAQIATEAQLLGAAGDQAAWDQALNQIPTARRSLYPSVWSKEAQARANQAGMTPDQRIKQGDVNNIWNEAMLEAGGDPAKARKIVEAHEAKLAQDKANAPYTAGMGGAGGGPNAGFLNDQGYDESALQGLDEGMKNTIIGLVEGRRPYPGNFAQRDPYWKKVLDIASKYDPGFDANRYKMRSDTLKDFTSGQAARNVTAINTAVGHLASLSKAADKLDNYSFPIVNKALNKLSTETGSPIVTDFVKYRDAVSKELVRVFRGMGGTGQEVKEAEEGMNAAQSPAQLKSGIQTYIDLMGSRIFALRDQFQKGTGRAIDIELLSPKSRKTLEDMGVDVESIEPKVEKKVAARPNVTPKPTEADHQYGPAYGPNGEVAYSNDGVTWYDKAGKKVGQ